MAEFPTVPVLIGAAGVVALLLLTKKESAAQPSTPLPPIPPLPNGNPNTPEAAALLAQATQVLMQATANPTAADPAQMETLAGQLDASGLTQQATALRNLAAQIRASRNLPPLPGGGPAGGGAPGGGMNQNPAFLPADLQHQMDMYLSSPTADPVMIDELVRTIQTRYPNGFLTQITQLQRRAKELRDRGPLQTLRGPFTPASPPPPLMRPRFGLPY